MRERDGSDDDVRHPVPLVHDLHRAADRSHVGDGDLGKKSVTRIRRQQCEKGGVGWGWWAWKRKRKKRKNGHLLGFKLVGQDEICVVN